MDRVDDDDAKGGRKGGESTRATVGRRGDTEADWADKPNSLSY